MRFMRHGSTGAAQVGAAVVARAVVDAGAVMRCVGHVPTAVWRVRLMYKAQAHAPISRRLCGLGSDNSSG